MISPAKIDTIRRPLRPIAMTAAVTAVPSNEQGAEWMFPRWSNSRRAPWAFPCLLALTCLATQAEEATDASDPVRDRQRQAYANKSAEWGHWGSIPEKYNAWDNHSNRLVPVYTFGIGLGRFAGRGSLYRDAARLQARYGYLPDDSVDPSAEFLDQTDLYPLQRLAVQELNKKYLFLIIFDGLDWPTTRAAAVVSAGSIPYEVGRGRGLLFQDYRGVPTDFGFLATSPAYGGMRIDVNTQRVIGPQGKARGGYSAKLGGATPWSQPASDDYLLGLDKRARHLVTDSAAAATAITSGIKTYNAAINVAPDGSHVIPIGLELQRESGYGLGIVTSVPISHATPAAAYAHNVSRGDYQDLTRDLLGLPSASHPDTPLPGVDVLIGCGWGESAEKQPDQGENFVPGNVYLTEADAKSVDYREGGNYVVAERTPGRPGAAVLQRAVDTALQEKKRLLGFFGQAGGHLAYRTADGRFDPLRERYSDGDVTESPRLAEMTRAALDVLDARCDKFWMMIEAGDVDWAQHANNLDDAIGAIFDGEDAFRVVVQWIERKGCWDDAAVIVTSDHGHYFVLRQPEALTPASLPEPRGGTVRPNGGL